MRALYGEGVACHTGSVPCVVDREVAGEALARGDAGWVLSRESALLGADLVGKWGRRNGGWRFGEPVRWPDVVTDPMHASKLLARKPGDLPAAIDRWIDGRIGKAKAVRR